MITDMQITQLQETGHITIQRGQALADLSQALLSLGMPVAVQNIEFLDTTRVAVNER